MDVGRSAYVSPGGCFIASAQRIRSLPVSEYNWLREWLQSWQEEEQGALRKSLADRMWPLMLGCKADLHSNISDAGCTAGMMYESGGELRPCVV